MDIFENDLKLLDIVLACKVEAGRGEHVHNDRRSHGFAFNINGTKRYSFSNGKMLTVGMNDIIYLPEHSYYTVTDIEAGDCFAINFKLFDSITAEPFVMHTRESARYYDIFCESEKIFREMKSGYTPLGKAKLYTIVYMMICERDNEYIPRDKNEKLAPALEYIHAHYNTDELDICELAKLCGIKEAYFRRLFSQIHGCSPIRYINELKLSLARKLLIESEHSIERIGELSGFNNTCYFHRCFKHHVGITPTEYKRRNR